MKASRRICNSAFLKQEFLKKWIKGLQTCRNFKEMNILDRKKAIKFSADVAIASTRNGATQWSQALMDDVVSAEGTNRILVEQILGYKVEKRALITCSKKILRRSHITCRKARRVVPPHQCVKSSCIAKKLVKKRTRVLKKLVPGGDKMDEICLIRETLDYIVSLRVQVDVMRHLATAAERLEPLRKHICN